MIKEKALLLTFFYYWLSFIYLMDEDFGIAENEDDIGFYVGIIASAYPAA